MVAMVTFDTNLVTFDTNTTNDKQDKDDRRSEYGSEHHVELLDEMLMVYLSTRR